jgi:hypothetical protein
VRRDHLSDQGANPLDIHFRSLPAQFGLTPKSRRGGLHDDDLEHAHERGLYFDTAIAGKSLLFVEAVGTHQKTEWAGQSFLLSPNQQFILWNLTGGLTDACVFGGHTSRRAGSGASHCSHQRS